MTRIRRMEEHWRGARKIALAGLFSVALGVSAGQIPASAAATTVSGGGFGFKTAVSLFGGPTMTRGTAAGDAVVDLPASGSVTPIVDYATSGIGQYGPAVIYTSGPLAVSTQGEKGDALRPGYVASSATATNVGTWVGVMVEDSTGVYEPALGGQMDPLVALEVSSACATREGGSATGTSTILGGRVVDTDSAGNPVNERQVAVNPAPNTVETGTLAHIGDDWRITFNEQTISPDGKSIVINAVHMELLGPTAVGDMYIGQSRCGYTS